MAPSRTILRVKRPRSVDPVSTLQFSGKKRARTVNDIAEQLATSSLANTNATTTGPLVWKRVETTEKQSNKRSLKVVEATLDNLVTDNKSSKRQRLALTLQQTPAPGPSPKSKRNVILDPISRLVNEKMASVEEGSATLQQFLDFCEQDERVRHDPAEYLSRATKLGNSNVLHLAALWNGVEEARHVLLRYPALLSNLLDAVDASGQRPYQVATMAGNEQVAQVLEAFGADTHDYVYDVFELAPTEEDQDTKATHVELRGGVGYLNEHGELILEALCPEDYGIDSDESVNQDDDDVDSNAEDHEFNDYPEEEDSDSDGGDDPEFRHNAVFLPHGGTVPVVTNDRAYPDDGDAEYDAQYGLYNGEAENDERHYAYDSEHDAE